jgi:hypothetical protein
VSLIDNNGTPKGTTSTTYIKMKEITLSGTIFPSGTMTLRFILYEAVGSGTAYGRIYRNGTPIGTERSTSSTNTANFYAEDFSFTDLKPGDTFELWAKHSTGGDTVNVAHFEIYAVNSIFASTLK